MKNYGAKRLIQLSSWRWAQSCSKHVEDSNKDIIKEIVRQFGYLPEFLNVCWWQAAISLAVDVKWRR